MKRFIKNSHGFSLIEILVGVGLTGVLALFGAQIFQGINKLVFQSSNEADLTGSRTLISKILNSNEYCTQNLTGLEPGAVIQKLAMKDIVALEVGKTVDLTNAAGPAQKYYMKGMRLANFTPFGIPLDEKVAGVITSSAQGIVEIEFSYATDIDNKAENNRTFTEIYHVLAKVDPKTKQVKECIKSFQYSHKDFCSVSLKGYLDPKTGFCHNLNLFSDKGVGPGLTMDHFPPVTNNYSLQAEDGMIIGFPPDVVSIGGSFNTYTQMFRFSTNLNSYYPNGTVKKVEERHEIYYLAKYTRNKTTMPDYELKEKRRVVIDPNGKNISRGWKPAEADAKNDTDYWKWKAWGKAHTEQNKDNWVFEKNPTSIMHPLKFGVPAHATIVMLFSVQGGVIITNNILADIKNDDTEMASEQTFEAVTYAYSSDKNLKEDIHSLTNGHSILDLKTYEYNFRDDDAHKSFGLMADEVKNIFPEAVRAGQDGYERVDYFSLLAPMLEKMKEQDKKLKEIKKEIKQLEDTPL